MKIFLFYFEMAIKITGSAQNYRVVRVSGNTPIFLGLTSKSISGLKFLFHLFHFQAGVMFTVQRGKGKTYDSI